MYQISWMIDGHVEDWLCEGYFPSTAIIKHFVRYLTRGGARRPHGSHDVTGIGIRRDGVDGGQQVHVHRILARLCQPDCFVLDVSSFKSGTTYLNYGYK